MSGQQDPGGDKNSMNLLWMIALFFLSVIGIWYFFGNWLKMGFIQVKLYQAKFYGLLGLDLDYLISFLGGLRPEELNYAIAEYIAQELSWYMWVPAFIIIALLGLIIWKGHVVMRFRKVYDMGTLAEQEVENWPQIGPVLGLNLIAQDVHEGPWAMALSPMQFAKKYKMITVERVADRKALWKMSNTFMATLDTEKAHRMFVSQLGPPWEGLNRLPKYTKAMFAVFAARMNHDTAAARDLLMQMSKTYTDGEIDYTGTNALLKKHVNSRGVRRIISHHAYVYTVMATMLALARLDGVQANADFLWLKAVDRRLWYVLSSVGRQVAFTEVGGPMAHWIVEKELGRPLQVPMVDQAVIALQESLLKMEYVPTEQELALLNKEEEKDEDENAEDDEQISAEELFGEE